MSMRYICTCWMLLFLVVGCTYDANFNDCTVACSAAAPDCPSGFTCSTAEGMCRAAENIGISCAAVLDGGGKADAATASDGNTGPDADPVCTTCDVFTGAGCPAGQHCILTGGVSQPYCISDDVVGTGMQGEACPCAPGYSGYGSQCRCYLNCTLATSCPANTTCVPYGGGGWDMCGIGVCM